MNSTITHKHFQLKKNVPELRAGDRVRVHQKIKEGAKERIQVFEGLVLKTQNGSGINGTFTVRRISLGVGIEKTFPLHLPSIVKVEKIKSAKVRRAKLYYIRDLIGKRANRLKKEKDSAGIWEDVVEEKVEKDPEQVQIEKEAEEADKVENPAADQPKANVEKEDVKEESFDSSTGSPQATQDASAEAEVKDNKEDEPKTEPEKDEVSETDEKSVEK